MERAGTNQTGRAIAYIKDALDEINILSETHIIDPFVSNSDTLSTIYFVITHYFTAIDKIRLPFFYLKFRA